MTPRYTKRTIWTLAIFASISLILFLSLKIEFLSDNNNQVISHTNTAVIEAAEIIMNECKSSWSHLHCYAQEVPKFAESLKVEGAFDVIDYLVEKDPDLSTECHLIAHGVGERLYHIDPENWMDLFLYEEAHECGSGLTHAAMIERFATETITKENQGKYIAEITNACATDESLDQNVLDACLHGVGHLTAIVTDGDSDIAFNICEKISKGGTHNNLTQCYSGILMQYLRPVEPEDFALVDKLTLKPTRDNVGEYCNSLKDSVRVSTCWYYSHFVFWLNRGFMHDDRYKTLCFSAPTDELEEACWHGFERSLRFIGYSDHRTLEVCGAQREERRLACYENSAYWRLRFFPDQPEKTVNFCNKIVNKEMKAGCLGVL